jgi:hypothetical protein
MSIQAGRYIEITDMDVKTIPLKEFESGFITR